MRRRDVWASDSDAARDAIEQHFVKPRFEEDVGIPLTIHLETEESYSGAALSGVTVRLPLVWILRAVLRHPGGQGAVRRSLHIVGEQKQKSHESPQSTDPTCIGHHVAASSKCRHGVVICLGADLLMSSSSNSPLPHSDLLQQLTNATISFENVCVEWLVEDTVPQSMITQHVLVGSGGALEFVECDVCNLPAGLLRFADGGQLLAVHSRIQLVHAAAGLLSSSCTTTKYVSNEREHHPVGCVLVTRRGSKVCLRNSTVSVKPNECLLCVDGVFVVEDGASMAIEVDANTPSRGGSDEGACGVIDPLGACGAAVVVSGSGTRLVVQCSADNNSGASRESHAGNRKESSALLRIYAGWHACIDVLDGAVASVEGALLTRCGRDSSHDFVAKENAAKGRWRKRQEVLSGAAAAFSDWGGERVGGVVCIGAGSSCALRACSITDVTDGVVCASGSHVTITDSSSVNATLCCVRVLGLQSQVEVLRRSRLAAPVVYLSPSCDRLSNVAAVIASKGGTFKAADEVSVRGGAASTIDAHGPGTCVFLQRKVMLTECGRRGVCCTGGASLVCDDVTVVASARPLIPDDPQDAYLLGPPPVTVALQYAEVVEDANDNSTGQSAQLQSYLRFSSVNITNFSVGVMATLSSTDQNTSANHLGSRVVLESVCVSSVDEAHVTQVGFSFDSAAPSGSSTHNVLHNDDDNADKTNEVRHQSAARPDHCHVSLVNCSTIGPYVHSGIVIQGCAVVVVSDSRAKATDAAFCGVAASAIGVSCAGTRGAVVVSGLRISAPQGVYVTGGGRASLAHVELGCKNSTTDSVPDMSSNFITTEGVCVCGDGSSAHVSECTVDGFSSGCIVLGRGAVLELDATIVRNCATGLLAAAGSTCRDATVNDSNIKTGNAGACVSGARMTIRSCVVEAVDVVGCCDVISARTVVVVPTSGDAADGGDTRCSRRETFLMRDVAAGRHAGGGNAYEDAPRSPYCVTRGDFVQF